MRHHLVYYALAVLAVLTLGAGGASWLHDHADWNDPVASVGEALAALLTALTALAALLAARESSRAARDARTALGLIHKPHGSFGLMGRPGDVPRGSVTVNAPSAPGGALAVPVALRWLGADGTEHRRPPAAGEQRLLMTGWVIGPDGRVPLTGLELSVEYLGHRYRGRPPISTMEIPTAGWPPENGEPWEGVEVRFELDV